MRNICLSVEKMMQDWADYLDGLRNTQHKKAGRGMKEDTMSDRDARISIGKIEGETQVTSNETGWSEEEKDRMRQYGYDDMDIIRAWYS